MKHLNWMTCIIFFCSCVPLVGFGSLPLEQYVRSVQLSAPMESRKTFSADTSNGSITVHGLDVKSVRMTATIKAQAENIEKARELAEATTVELVPGRSGVETQIESPRTGGNQSVRVDMDVYVPANSNVNVQSHNGDVVAENCDGALKVKSQNGKISTRNTSGDAYLQAYNGRISCVDISGNAELRSYNGRIRAVYRESADQVCDISMLTHNGGIELVTPPDFSASVQASTRNGTITTDVPISVLGKVGLKHLNGTLGTGEGRLHLETYNGSIEIR